MSLSDIAHARILESAQALIAERDAEIARLRADLAPLRDLLVLCQEQRLLLRDVAQAPTSFAREQAAARAAHHWHGLARFLETLALNVPSPGAAVAGRLADLVAERDAARERTAAHDSLYSWAEAARQLLAESGAQLGALRYTPERDALERRIRRCLASPACPPWPEPGEARVEVEELLRRAGGGH
jgi:hypothetical protein